MTQLNIPLGQIAALIDGSIEGDSGITISGPGTLDGAEDGQIIFVDKIELIPLGEESAAAALIVPPGASSTKKPLVITEDPRLAFSKVLELFATKPRVEQGIHPTAVVGQYAQIAPTASIGAHSVIEDNAIIEDGAIIYPLAYIGHEAIIRKDAIIYPHVFIAERVIIGCRSIIQAGAMIGCDGFGFLQTPAGHRKIPQIGNVIIGDDVEIGACSTVDRATVSATRIGNGTKIDDHVHVAHNCVIGENCLFCGQVGIAGSSTVGDNVVMGGQVGVNDHVTIGDNIIFGGGTAVMGDVLEPGIYSGYGALPHGQSLRMTAATVRLPDLIKKVRTMERRLAELEKLLDAKTE